MLNFQTDTMDRIRTFLCFLWVLYHSVSPLELTGPSVHAARLGSDTLVPCMFILDNVDLTHLTIFWHFQDKEILNYNKNVRTTSRYSLSTEALRVGIANLSISNVQIQDGGTYKCSVIYRSERKQNEIRLDIGTPPQVTITDRTVVMNTESLLRCSITGFYPVDIDVKWFRDEERLKAIPVENHWRNPDRTYNVNSSVTIIPTEEDRKRTFSCRVQHEFLLKPFQNDFRLVYEDRSSAGVIAVCSVLGLILILILSVVLWWKLRRKANRASFTVRDIKGPSKLIDGEEATLYCTVDDCPEDLCVTWLIRKDGEDQEIQTSKMRGHEEEEESLLDTSYVIKSQREGHQYLTSLSFIPHMERHRDATFICRGVFKNQKDKKTFHCKTIYGKPKLSQPIMRSLLISGPMKYLLNLEKFYPKTIRIVWTCGVGRTEEVSSTNSISDNPDRSYNVSSEVTIPEDRHKDPEFRVRVTWKHESMEEPEYRELSIRDKDYIWTPVVEDIQIPRLHHNTPATLQCNISEYFPDAVTVRWMRRAGDVIYEETDTADNQRITTRRAADNTYMCTASLTITPTLGTHQGAEYICVVNHPSLERPIERRTRKLQVIDLAWCPHVGSITIPELEDDKEATLTCNISGYFPDNLSVTWFTIEDGNLTALHEESVKKDRRYKISEKKKKQGDNTYCCEASMTFTPLIRSDQGSEILCRVEHPSLEAPIERRSGPLHILLPEVPIERRSGPLHIGVKRKIGERFKDFFTINSKEKETQEVTDTTEQESEEAPESRGAEPEEDNNGR